MNNDEDVRLLRAKGSVRLLRAKAGELENRVLLITEMQEADTEPVYIAATEFKFLTADIALIATLLADHIEDSEAEKLDQVGWVTITGEVDEAIDDANVRDMRDWGAGG